MDACARTPSSSPSAGVPNPEGPCEDSPGLEQPCQPLGSWEGFLEED